MESGGSKKTKKRSSGIGVLSTTPSSSSKKVKQQQTLFSFMSAKKPKAHDNQENNSMTPSFKKSSPSVMVSSGQKRKENSTTMDGPTSATKKVKRHAPQPLKYLKKPYTGGEKYALLTQPQEMFDDMIARVMKNPQKLSMLSGLVQKLCNRPLRIATMCSGTESPVLALDMFQKAIEVAVRDHPEQLGVRKEDADSVFRLEHVFSCEIEPFKQAYIERNFHPPLLFRDIRELGNEKAYTAYGALVPVPNRPGDVDVLIAGTSCVDYSNLNNSKKEMEEAGESGSTFYGMMKWIEQCQPPIVILENVYGAPWAKKVKMFQAIGYAAHFVRLDTKDYYIPHTRQRGYLFAIHKLQRSKQGKERLDQRPKTWEAMVQAMARPASATLDEYLLPRDDPRVLRGRARLTVESDKSAAGRTDWTKCETRHLAARSIEELGEQRPFTNWSDSGNTRLPAWCWSEWYDQQVNRIHDLSDINTLRLAVDGVDATHKTMVWNLSQNVDRDTMGKLGLCQCLTPTGVPYITNRGGPAVGEELLMLQGIPADDLLLTKESEDNLKDLAGNAMSTTVVGACTLCALLVGYASLPDREGGGNRGLIVPSLVPRPLLPITNDIQIVQKFGNYEQSVVSLAPSSLPDLDAWKQFLEDASSSTRMCVSEGTEECIPYNNLVQCQDCGQTTASSHAFPPRRYEEHDFVPMSVNSKRVRKEPSSFRKNLLRLLPMRVIPEGFDLDGLITPNIDKELWNKWLAAFRRTVTMADKPMEFQYTELLRSHIWTAVYRSCDGGRLEVRVSKFGVTWLLFAKPSKKKGPLKLALEKPLARMIVTASCQDRISLMEGKWEYLLPVRSAVSLSVEGVGEKVPSWRNRLGLKGRFERELTYSELRITANVDDSAVKDRIDGLYKLLPKCGSACGSLMKRINNTSANEGEETFFFLASGQKTVPEDDAYVFSPCCHRVAPGEYLEIFLEVDPHLNFRPLVDETTEFYNVQLRAFKTGKWSSAGDATVRSFDQNNACEMSVSRPSPTLIVPMQKDAWKACPALVSWSINIQPEAIIFQQVQKSGGSVEFNLQKSSQTFKNLAFATSRLQIPDLFGDGNWLHLPRQQTSWYDEQKLGCPKCAPERPKVKWILITKGKTSIYTPMEDGIEAAEYERTLKARPQPWIVRLALHDERNPAMTLTVGCNAYSLVQRAFSLLQRASDGRKYMVAQSKASNLNQSDSKAACSFEWRVVPHIEKEDTTFDKLKFSSNRRDEQADQPPNFKKYPLRKEQLRSLKWMIQQESTTEPFFEEEVAEAVLPSLNWRAEARVRRPVLVRAGVIADEVGYGKTAISLGLIDSTRATKISQHHVPAEFRDAYIATEATCVCVPKHLMGQWPDEIRKFLEDTMNVIVLDDLSSLNKITVRDIQNADVVIVSFALLSNDKYFARLARLSGKNPASIPTGTNGGRHFTAVYKECTKALGARIADIKRDCSTVYGAIEKDAASHQNQHDAQSVRLDGKKAVYKKGEAASDFSTNTKYKMAGAERDPWGLKDESVKKDFTNMKCPPLEAFLWKRVIVDEFTYLGKADRERCFSVINETKSLYRWMLSGTPKHSNFNDINGLAGLLGVQLGIDEVLPGAKLSKAQLSESTGLESLSSYLESRSMQWHERRHRIGQDFLNRFVRQNIAEIDEIPFEEHECVVDLPPAERAIYLELETHLNSLEMNSKNAQKSKRKSTGDRESRMQKVLQESKTGEEALLKCCSTFALAADSSTALETIDQIISLRVSEKKHLEDEFIRAITAALHQRQRIVDFQPGWTSLTDTGKGEMQDALGVYLDQVAKNASVPHGADKVVNFLIQNFVKEAEAAFQSNPHSTEKNPFFADEEVDDEDEADDDNEQNEGGSAKKKKQNKKLQFKDLPAEKQTLRLLSMKTALRNHCHGLRSYGKELCGRLRSLRYVELIRSFQLENRDGFECVCCKKRHMKATDVGVLSCCGHHGCVPCLRSAADSGQCLVSECTARVSSSHIVNGAQFCVKSDGSKVTSGRFGSKLSAIVEKVKEIIEQHDDRVIVFSQFDDLTEKVKEALSASGVKSTQVSGTVKQQTQTIKIFQRDVPEKGDPRVLLLKMDDEQSAGLNLTNLNHAIFVHPLLADTQQEYDAYETQAIGRIRRFGQKKTVHVWRFLARDTIDTTIFAKRSKRPIPSFGNT